ncbi:MAG: hypothetical protein ACD_62C00304G0004 [uncultured bacterium]|nr:MAG: hypothetical protein ACD_62C00304G0004 [uncultured bacterium]HLD44807.1 hypothetical protein [bacterium]
MKKYFSMILLTLCLSLLPPMLYAEGKVDQSSCSYNGRALYGKVQVVTAFPDLKVQKVTAFPDLKVEQVSAFPDSCGKWQMVDAFPDLKIQFVDAFPDITIQYVTAFPGV